MIIIGMSNSLLTGDCPNTQPQVTQNSTTVQTEEKGNEKNRKLTDGELKPSDYNSIDPSQKKNMNQIIINDLKGVFYILISILTYSNSKHLTWNLLMILIL